MEKDGRRLLDLLHLGDAELSILITNDRNTRRLNRDYRGKDRTTDVLSFPMQEEGDLVPAGVEFLLGDVVLNAHMAHRLSLEYRTPVRDILRSLLIHGLLHLAGHDHERNPKAAEKMKQKERRLANALAKLDREPQ